MLFRLADHEVRVAEACAERQRPYRPPDRWSLNTLTYSTFYEPFTAPHRERHERWQETLRRFRAGDEEARAAVVRVININNSRRLPTNLDPEEFKPRWPHDFELQRLNPGRAVAGLEQRGFVLCDHYRRRYNVALTVKGFAEARRLGGVRQSEVVDLDQVQAAWRDPSDFRLGMSRWEWPHDDDRPPLREGAVRQINP